MGIVPQKKRGYNRITLEHHYQIGDTSLMTVSKKKEKKSLMTETRKD